jgi:hypothetical protein
MDAFPGHMTLLPVAEWSLRINVWTQRVELFDALRYWNTFRCLSVGSNPDYCNYEQLRIHMFWVWNSSSVLFLSWVRVRTLHSIYRAWRTACDFKQVHGEILGHSSLLDVGWWVRTPKYKFRQGHNFFTTASRPASYPIGIKSKVSRNANLATHLRLVTRCRMRGAVTLRPV